MNKPVVFVLVFFSVISMVNAFADEAEREVLKIYGRAYPEYSIYHHSIQVVKQTASPVTISVAHATYIPKLTGDVVRSRENAINKIDWWNYKDEGILITLDANSETAVAVQYGVHVFNSFNEYLGGFEATEMDIPRTGMKWLYRNSDIFTFKGYGYVFVFVAKARLEDGSIWTYDPEEVNAQIGPKVKRFKLEEE